MSNIYSREELVQLFQRAYAAEDVEAVNEISAELERLDSKSKIPVETVLSPTQAVVEDSFVKDQAKAGAADFIFKMLPDKFFGVDGLSEKYTDAETGEYNYQAYGADLAAALDIKVLNLQVSLKDMQELLLEEQFLKAL